MDFVGGTVRISDGNDKLLVRFQPGQLIGDFVGERARFPAARASDEKDAPWLQNGCFLLGIQIIFVPTTVRLNNE